MSINKLILLLPLLISISSALECRKCYDFPNAGSLVGIQQLSFTGVIKLAANPPVCDGTSQYTECTELQDECHGLSVSSKLGEVSGVTQKGIGGRKGCKIYFINICEYLFCTL